jgi:hypothetical protein
MIYDFVKTSLVYTFKRIANTFCFEKPVFTLKRYAHLSQPF